MSQVMNMKIIDTLLFTGGCKRGFHILYPITYIDMGRRRDTRAVSASMLVFFLYGTLIWGLLPNKASISWETHLIAALIGLVLALLFRRLDVPPRKRYAWEDEDDGNGDHRSN